MIAETLSEYRSITIEIEKLLEQRQSMRSLRSNIIDGMPKPKGHSQSKTENAALAILEIEDDIYNNIMRLSAIREEVEEIISDLPSRERTLFRLRYMDGLTFEKIADVMYYSRQQIHTIHDNTIARLEREHDGKTQGQQE